MDRTYEKFLESQGEQEFMACEKMASVIYRQV